VSSVKLSNIESDLKRIRESLDTMGGHVQSVLEGVELTRDALDAILEASEEIEAGEDEGEEE
jgi:molecular chaperone GrpE (heat shock protein)